ncbi:MAG: peptide-methionine (S)-S-oxide reductase MsrA [Verrucomicrobiota bacterium]
MSNKRFHILQGGKTLFAFAALLPMLLITACADDKPTTTMSDKPKATTDINPENLETATFGAGCFWCTEAVMERQEGVYDVVSGYMGGHTLNPTYKEICTGQTGHAEVIQVKFDPAIISYEELLSVFWAMHDPTTLNRQGADVGTQYRSAIYYYSDEQLEKAKKSKSLAQKHFNDPIVTEITPAEEFYVAEVTHQDYYNENRNAGYCRYVIAPKLKKLGLE